MPAAIERCVRRQNILFMHNKNQYCMEYFQFIRKLITCNGPYVQPDQGQEKLVSDQHRQAGISGTEKILVEIILVILNLFKEI